MFKNVNLFCFFLFVVTKIIVITNNSKEIEELLFQVNYFSVVLLMVINIRHVRIDKFNILLIGLSIVFLTSGQLQQGFSCLLLLYVATSYSRCLIQIKKINIKERVAITLIFVCFVAILSFSRFVENGLISSYGRNQILFGINHPKEQAGLVLFLFFTLWRDLKLKFSFDLFIKIIVYIMLVLTDSRSLLFGFILFNLLEHITLRKFYFAFFSIILLFSIPSLLLINFDFLNDLSSHRLELWLNLLLIGYSMEGLSVDSSWLEFGRNGLIYLIPFCIIFLFINIKIYDLNKFVLKSRQSHDIGAFTILYLFSFTFDIGAFSATNLIAIVVWGNLFYYKRLMGGSSSIPTH